MQPIASIVGGIVGATMIAFLMASLLDWVIFRRFVQNPVTVKIASTVAAYMVLCLLRWLSEPEGIVEAVIFYAIGGFITFQIKLWEVKRKLEKNVTTEAFE